MATTKADAFLTSCWSQMMIDEYKKTVVMSGMPFRDKYSQMLYKAAEKAEEMAKKGELDKFTLA